MVLVRAALFRDEAGNERGLRGNKQAEFILHGDTARISTFSERRASSVTLPISFNRPERPFVPITSRSGRISNHMGDDFHRPPSSTRKTIVHHAIDRRC